MASVPLSESAGCFDKWDEVLFSRTCVTLVRYRTQEASSTGTFISAAAAIRKPVEVGRMGRVAVELEIWPRSEHRGERIQAHVGIALPNGTQERHARAAAVVGTYELGLVQKTRRWSHDARRVGLQPRRR